MSESETQVMERICDATISSPEREAAARNYEFQKLVLGLLGVIASMGISSNAEHLQKYGQGQEVAEIYETLLDKVMKFSGEV